MIGNTLKTFLIDRSELARVFSPRAAKAFEQMQDAVVEQGETQTANVDATEAIAQASYVTLSPNTELPNEFVLTVGTGLGITAGGGVLTLYSTGPRVSGGHSLNFIVNGASNVAVPLAGTLATIEGIEILANKTLAAPRLTGLVNAANDAAASAGGVPVDGIYRNGSVLMVRAS